MRFSAWLETKDHKKSLFRKDDAGRQSEEYNDCTVRALALVTRSPYADAHKYVAERGRKPGEGWDTRSNLKSSGTALGMKYRWTGFKQSINPYLFAQSNPVGRFLLIQPNHVFVVLDGVIHDMMRPGIKEVGGRKSVYGCWEFADGEFVGVKNPQDDTSLSRDWKRKVNMTFDVDKWFDGKVVENLKKWIGQPGYTRVDAVSHVGNLVLGGTYDNEFHPLQRTAVVDHVLKMMFPNGVPKNRILPKRVRPK